MIRTKGEAGTGNVVEAVRHCRAVQGAIKRIKTMDDDELFAYLPLEDSILELLKKFAEVSDDDKKEKLKLFRVMMSLMVLVSAQIKFCGVFDSLIDCAQALMRMSLIHNVAPYGGDELTSKFALSRRDKNIRP